MSRQVPGPAGHLRHPARRVGAAGAASTSPPPSSSPAPATGGSRRPAFEDTELFARGVGHSDRHRAARRCSPSPTRAGAASTLRPEGTAPIGRAYLEHGMHTLAQPVKLWYWGPFFRHERPQAGRFRQFNQLDAEAIGSDSPLVDAELIILLDELLRELGVPGRAPAARQPRLARLARRLPRGAHGLPAPPRGRAAAERARADRAPTRCAPSTPTTRAPAR